MGAPVESHGDHRLAMTMTAAGLLADGTTTVYGAEVTEDSFPGFGDNVASVGCWVVG